MTDPQALLAEQAAEVVGKLTSVLKRELLTLSEHSEFKTLIWSARYGYRLERMGLARRTLLTDRTRLTPLGLACRAILIERQGK